jgi:hypothetical protein
MILMSREGPPPKPLVLVIHGPGWSWAVTRAPDMVARQVGGLSRLTCMFAVVRRLLLASDRSRKVPRVRSLTCPGRRQDPPSPMRSFA